MPMFHTTLFFSQPPRWGWVEQFWWEGADLASGLAAAQQLAQARYSILGAGTNLYRVRVSVPHQPRQSASVQIAGKTLSVPARHAIDCLEVRLQGSGSPPHRRSYVLGGLPNGAVIDRGGGVGFAPWITTAATAWLDSLTKGGWRLQVNQPVGPVLPLLGIAVAADVDRDIFGSPLNPPTRISQPQWLWLGVEGDLPPLAQSVRVWGVKVLPKIARYAKGVNGEFPLLAFWANGALVEGSTYGIVSMSGGQVQFYLESFSPIAIYDLVAVVGRKRGPAKAPKADSFVGPLVGGLVAPPGQGGLPAPFDQPTPEVPVNTYQTARDMVREVFVGYSDVPGSHQKTIGIAHATNQPVDTYVVFVPGVDVGSLNSNFEEWWSGVAALFAIEDRYTEFVEKTVRDNVPAGARVIWAGHSLGGMSCQWARKNRGRTSPLAPPNLIGFGSPVFAAPFLDITGAVGGLGSNTLYSWFAKNYAPRNAYFFGYRLDPCTFLSPAGSWAWIDAIQIGLTGGVGGLISAMLRISWFPWTTLLSLPDDILPDLFRLHMNYPNDPQLDDYNWIGASDPGQTSAPLITGPVTRYLYPSPP